MKTANITATLVDHMGTDLSVVNAARVSFHKESQEFVDKDVKLINYLARHKHTSPFNHAFLTFRVKAPIFVARQLVKHKFMPWNEVSRRYVDEEPEFYFPQEWRKRPDVSVKQGSGTETTDFKFTNPDTGMDLRISEHFTWLTEQNMYLYDQMITNGVAPEMARMVLPQNMMTEWIWSGTLGAFCDMLKLRLDEHTQYESRVVAQQIQEQIAQLFPVSMKALLEN